MDAIRRLMRYFLTLALVSLGVWVTAQIPTSSVTVGWDKPAVPPAGYRITVDNVIRDVGLPPISPRCNCHAVAVPVVPGTSHMITVSSYDGAGTISEPSAPLILPAECLPNRSIHDCWNVEPSLPVWQATDIGAYEPRGRSAVVPSGNFTLESGGLGLQDAADTLYFVHREIAGDGTLTARVNAISAGIGGVHWRETTDPGARHITVGYRPDTGIEMTVRAAAGSVPVVVALRHNVTPSVWLRVSRVGNAFTAEFSKDRNAWVHIGTVTVPMAGLTRVGMFTASTRTDAVSLAQFDDVVRIP